MTRAEELAECEKYAKEGWDWLSEALDALGAKTVFDIAKRKAAAEALAEALDKIEAEPESWHTVQKIAREALADYRGEKP